MADPNAVSGGDSAPNNPAPNSPTTGPAPAGAPVQPHTPLFNPDAAVRALAANAQQTRQAPGGPSRFKRILKGTAAVGKGLGAMGVRGVQTGIRELFHNNGWRMVMPSIVPAALATVLTVGALYTWPIFYALGYSPFGAVGLSAGVGLFFANAFRRKANKEIKTRQAILNQQAGPGGARRVYGVGIKLGMLAGAFMGIVAGSWGLSAARDAAGIHLRPINPLLTFYMDHYVNLAPNAPPQRPWIPPSLWQPQTPKTPGS